MVKPTADAAAITSVAAAFAGWLPNVALLLTILWTLIRIYETNTVQKMLGNKITKKEEDKDG